MSALPPLRKRVVVPCTVPELFGSFATTAGAITFFAPAACIEPHVGGAYELLFDEEAEPGRQGSEGCVVKSIDPPRSLVVTWNFPPELARLRRERTELSLSFAAIAGEGAEVHLVHDGFRGASDPATNAEWEEGHRYFNRAWGTVLTRLVSRWKRGPIVWDEGAP